MGNDDEIDVSGPGSASRPGPIANVDGPGVEAAAPVAAGETLDIAAALASGRIDASEAQALLIESVLAEQLPPGSSPAQLEALRNELSALLSGDPTLARLLG